jgi:glycosyltransferase involved in cell wall biosynthesis
MIAPALPDIFAVRERVAGLKSSLTMIVPVRNDAGSLTHIFSHALEILPELTPRWNLVLIDDGSSDATPEVLADLARNYPQVSVLHHSVSKGDSACFRRGALVTHSDLLLMRASDCDLDLTGMQKMWKRAASHPLVVARSHGEDARDRIALGGRRKPRATARGPGLQLIQRRALSAWLAGHEDHDLQGYLQAKRYPQHEVELRRWDMAWLPAQRLNSTVFVPQHCDRGETAGRPKRPNYLLRLKAFALGE